VIRRAVGAAVCALMLLAPAGAGASTAPVPPLPPSPVSSSLQSALRQVTVVLANDCSISAVADDPGVSTVCEADAEQAGTDAFVYGIPLMEFLRQRQQQTSVNVPNALSDAPVNQFGNARQLATATPGHQVFVQPNNDTLYSMAHLWLGNGPLVLHVPAVPDGRYYVMQFLDPYTNVFAYVGTRTTGDRAGSYVIVGPDYHGTLPRGLPVIRSAYERAWIAGRTLVYGPSDLPEVHRIQNGYRLIPLASYERAGLRWHPRRPRHVISTATAATVPTGLAFFDALGSALAENPPPAADGPVLSELAAVGVGIGMEPSQQHLSAPVLAGLAAAGDGGLAYIDNMRTIYAAQDAIEHHGWFVPFADTGSFGTDYQWRAIVSVYGLAANEPAEAVYTIGILDQDETQLNGAHDYVIHFPAGALPPAKYFWSLTMYDSSFYLVPNVINRYSLGNRSALHYNADGSLDIYLQHAAPPAGEQSNWLPAPSSGTFEVTLRMYGPGDNVLGDTYTYPQITRTG
jgi:hypothetical protein